MVKKLFSIAAALWFFLGCADIPDELVENAKEDKCDSVFNSETHFCYRGEVHNRCNGMRYNPTTHICQGTVANPARCSDVQYNPLEQRCQGSVVETQCGATGWYNVVNQRCENNVVETKCGTAWYNAANTNLDCQSSIVVTNCGMDWYNTENANLRCQSNMVETKCGTAWYNAADANLDCHSNVVVTNCGTDWYNATNANLRCQNNIVETKCGASSSWYDTANANLRCQNNIVETKCGASSSWYDATNANLRCKSDVVETKCGTAAWFDNSISTMEHCSNGTLKTYETVTIGEQTWMAENLNYDTENGQCYNNLESNCGTFGRLYNWMTAMNLPVTCMYISCSDQIQLKHKGICPEGWHIPTKAEWDVLNNFVGGSFVDFKHLKSQEGWEDCGPSGSGKSYSCEDTYGFAALPGGVKAGFDWFLDVGYGGYWWTASEYSCENCKDMAYSNWYKHVENSGWGSTYKGDFYSVRCLQD
jgi:uncharacterized protein (TIGR02145 family)